MVAARFEQSEKKKKLIEEFLKKPIAVGDYLNVKQKALSSYGSEDKAVHCEVISINPLKVRHDRETSKISEDAIISRGTRGVGANNFTTDRYEVRYVQFNLDSILSSLRLGGYSKEEPFMVCGKVPAIELNWNPYVYNSKGEKTRYQRDFVWTEEDNRLLIDSIYNGIDCGKIIIRKHEFDYLERICRKGEKELSFSDVVDGKQRLNAVSRFITNQYADSYGDYFSDLSDSAQHKFLDGFAFGYAEMRNATDEQVISQFLKMNHLGKPQSREHIEFVKSLNSEYKS